MKRFLLVLFLVLVLFVFAGCNNGNNVDKVTVDDNNCLSLNDLNRSDVCWIAVGGVVYDQTDMPKWGLNASHCGCVCGGSYSVHVLPASHSGPRYFGPVVGKLCKE